MTQEKMKNHYIDFAVTPYALADVCEALFNNGVHNGFLTKEDGDIHIRWRYDITRNRPIKKEVRDYNSSGIIQRLKKQGANSVTITKGDNSITNAQVVSHPTVIDSDDGKCIIESQFTAIKKENKL